MQRIKGFIIEKFFVISIGTIAAAILLLCISLYSYRDNTQQMLRTMAINIVTIVMVALFVWISSKLSKNEVSLQFGCMFFSVGCFLYLLICLSNFFKSGILYDNAACMPILILLFLKQLR